jgi:DNA-binding NtrC family response regulator
LLDGVGADPQTGDLGSDSLPGGIVPLEEVEREMVHRAMEATDGNQTRAAELLGISRDQLRYRLKKQVG